jgi:hypothetical protein
MRTGYPLQLATLQLFSITGGMNIINLQRKLKPGQKLTERHHAAGHDANHQGIGAGKSLVDVQGHVRERCFHSPGRMQAIRLLQNFPRLLRADRVQRWFYSG